MLYNILVCDDDKDIVNAIAIYLKAEGYEVFKAYDGREALDIIEREKVHLLILDVMMPHLDGITALSLLREKYNLPVILLTAKSEDTDKILGLNVGADDYVTKPFNPLELMARVRSHLRRYMQLGAGDNQNDSSVITIGSVRLDDNSKEVRVDGEIIKLTRTEYDILKLLMDNPGRLFSPKELYEKVWNEQSFGNEGTVAVHIRHLREKIEINPSEPRYLKMVWARGYLFDGKGRK